MLRKLSVVFLLFPTALLSMSTCEDDISFMDSFGWTCRDYGRAPEECKLSEKYETNGKMALKSCCVCRNPLNTPGNILEGLGTSFLDQISMTRRQSEDCLQGCSTDSETCSTGCGSVQTTCTSRCDDARSTCNRQCKLADENEDEDDEPGGVVDDEDESKNTSVSPAMEWYFILLIVVLVLGLLVCCSIIIYFVSNRTKVAVAGPSQNVRPEQAPMVDSSNYAREVDKYYRPRPQAQYENIYGDGRRNVSAYYY